MKPDWVSKELGASGRRHRRTHPHGCDAAGLGLAQPQALAEIECRPNV
jgi:hypothetical protein